MHKGILGSCEYFNLLGIQQSSHGKLIVHLYPSIFSEISILEIMLLQLND